MNRLSKLAKKKDKLKKKLSKIRHKIDLINKEALSYAGKGSRGQDLFISCLVNDLHFELVPEEKGVDDGESSLERSKLSQV